jgi:hypothetical protein
MKMAYFTGFIRATLKSSKGRRLPMAVLNDLFQFSRICRIKIKILNSGCFQFRGLEEKD